MHVCAVLQQQPGRFDIAGARHRHERGLPFCVRGVGIRARGQQCADDCAVAGHRREAHRGDAELVGRLHVRAGSNQLLHRVDIRRVHGTMQRRGAIGLGRDAHRGPPATTSR